ncbi:MAG: hypothetical protein IPK16_26780 [Anaerolineales bacterium]|nr:hypothetical protein [Anaerolineales bacterium]
MIDGHYDWIGNDLFQAEPPVVEAPVLVNPPAGAVTSNFLFTAQGFTPGERIELSVRLAGSEETLAQLDDASAQLQGYATWTWAPGSEVEPGDYEVVAFGTESETGDRRIGLGGSAVSAETMVSQPRRRRCSPPPRSMRTRLKMHVRL